MLSRSPNEARLVYLILENEKGFPLHPFLNKVIIYLETSYFDFVGIAVFGGLALFLIWCVMKGNIKLGTRFMIISFHPMK